MTLVRSEPLQELKSMQDKMTRRLAAEGEPMPTAESLPEPWQPPADIYENDESYVIRLELPGLDQSQIEVCIEEKTLIVRGDRPLLPAAGVIFRRLESSHGPFARTFLLPEEIDQAGIRATCERGLLQVVLPKRQASGVRHIEVEVRRS
ncbi:MAG: hypothetical protein A2091_02110 [Desulfuromonadales bacterium GWD2_61_12]|nr:MAG: hypothetical protein A2005_05205 [Desulfuromonadales bacterium GWC2_61_20]OGR36185.1 MAG: hypothetical protein A2091_02110 [Desulfuromonadales bacterium GWD2_61_12]